MMEDNYDQMLIRVKEFIYKSIGIPTHQLTEETLVEDDLGMAGLDTHVFYDTFFSEFGITNPEDFNAKRYVTPEVVQLSLIIKSFFSKQASEKLTSKTVTIRHLTQVALQKRWFDT